MTVRLVIDMNLSPEWVRVLANYDVASVHWAQVGDAKARDAEIMQWARANDYVVFTHDLDFGGILALTHATGPSVIQIRGRRVLPESGGAMVVAALSAYEKELEEGALLVVEEGRQRVRILPIARS